MTESREDYTQLLNKTFDCSCGRQHKVPIQAIIIRHNALAQIPALFEKMGFPHNVHVHLVADCHTFSAAGRNTLSILTAHGVQVTTTLFEDEFLAADQNAVERVCRETSQDTECILAVGSGTLNDICRYAAFTLGKPYAIVATAPSMDGYASSVSPLLVNGFKRTFEAIPPAAIIGDLGVLCKAPPRMIAAGFGDLLGKLTCQADWKLSRLLKGEYLCTYVTDLIEKAVEICRENAEGLSRREPQAIESLMQGLVLSGLGMLMVENSRPASGCEHHLSHYWEMKLLEDNPLHLLHGEKVGVASVLMARIYNRLADFPIQQATGRNRSISEVSVLIRKAFGPLSEEVLKENEAETGGAPRFPLILEKWPEIRSILLQVPHWQEVEALLNSASAPASPVQLEIDGALVREGLENCMYVRTRYTVLRLVDELGLDPVSLALE